MKIFVIALAVLLVTAGNSFAEYVPPSPADIAQRAKMQKEADEVAKVSLSALIALWQGRDSNWRPQAEERLRLLMKASSTDQLAAAFVVTSGKPKEWLAYEIVHRDDLTVATCIKLAESAYDKANSDEQDAHQELVLKFQYLNWGDHKMIDRRALKSMDEEIKKVAREMIESQLMNPPVSTFFYLLGQAY